MQTRLQSFIEKSVDTASAMLISWVIGLWLYPVFFEGVTPSEVGAMTIIMTVVSFVRGYCWRRFFNWYHNPARKIRAWSRAAEQGKNLPYCKLCGSAPLPSYHNPDKVGCGAGVRACAFTEQPEQSEFTHDQWRKLMQEN